MAKNYRKRFIVITAAVTLCIASAVAIVLSLNMGEDKTRNNNEVLSKEPQGSRKEEIANTESKSEEAVAESKSEEAIVESKEEEENNGLNNKPMAEAQKEWSTATNARKDIAAQTGQESPESDERKEAKEKEEQETDRNEEAKQTETDTKGETNESSESDSTEDKSDTTEPEAELERLKELTKQYSSSITQGGPKKRRLPI